jgi:hypothetical protein
MLSNAYPRPEELPHNGQHPLPALTAFHCYKSNVLGLRFPVPQAVARVKLSRPKEDKYGEKKLASQREIFI